MKGHLLLMVLAMLALAGCRGLVPLPSASGPPVVVAEAVEPSSAPASPPTFPLAECEARVADGAWAEAPAACDSVPAAARVNSGLAERLGAGYLAEGRAALSKGDVAGALTWFERAYQQRPDSAEAAREYALALAYRAGEATLAAGNWEEALAKFQAVHDADRLYLAWLPERAPRRRQADVHVAWGLALVEERRLDEAEQHCKRAEALAPEVAEAGECLAAVVAVRPPTPTPTRTATPVPPRGVVPVRPPVAPPPPRPAAPPVAAPAPRPAAPAAPPAPAPPPSAPAERPVPAAPVFGAPVN